MFADYDPDPLDRATPFAGDIRAATTDDARAIATVFVEREGGDLDEVTDAVRGEITKIAVRKTRQVWVATEADVVLAYGRATSFDPPANAPPEAGPRGWYLGGVVVTVAHRRRGIGHALTRVRLDWIAKRATEAYYCSSEHNATSIALHQAFGFEEVCRGVWMPGMSFNRGQGILFRVPLTQTTPDGYDQGMQGNDPNERWELPWPRLEVPSYRDVRVGAWSIESVMLIAPRGYFHEGAAGGVRTHTMLVRHDWVEPVTVMSTLPMEIESNAQHVAAASGTVVVMGAGLGLTVHNMLKKPDVERVIVVERDPDVIELLRQGTDMESWDGFEKLTFVIADALTYVPDEQVDTLYADIWEAIGAPEGLADTQTMQRNVRAKRVGWWGQELDFARWLLENDHGFPATTELYERWAASIGLPLACPGDASYVGLIETAARRYPAKVGLESAPSAPVAAALHSPVDEEGLLESASAPDGTRLTLRQRTRAAAV